MTASVKKQDKRNRETPHDKFVKCALKNQAIAVDFLAAHWSEIGLGKQELSEIILSNNEYNQPGKAKLQSDLVYRTQIADQAYILPIEHQSTPTDVLIGVSLEIGNYCTLSLFFNQT